MTSTGRRKMARAALYAGGAFAAIGGVLAAFGRHLEAEGWKRAGPFIHTEIVNAYVRLRNRLGRRPRVECPFCRWRGYEFLTLDCGWFTVPSVKCPHCYAHERHRMLKLYLDRKHAESLTSPGRLLHFAPEDPVRSIFLQNPQLFCISTDYTHSAILKFAGTAAQCDMQELGFADDSFDLILCLHVLEHIPDDRQGIRELCRILKPGGTAYIVVPFMTGWEKTVEFGEPDPAMWDHVRGYAPNDFEDRLKPFAYEKVVPSHFLTQEEISRYRIPNESQVIFRCTKP